MLNTPRRVGHRLTALLVGATLVALAAAAALIMYRGGPDVSNIMFHAAPVPHVYYHG
jgi:hypothetical protein